MDFPTPAETQAVGRAVLEETARRKRSAAIYAFTVFLRDLAPDMTGNGDERTNIIDQGEKKTYALYEPEKVRALFEHLEKCRLEEQTLHFSERQGTEKRPRTGIMLDYDMYFRKRPDWPVLSARHYHRITSRIVAQLRRDIEWTPRGAAAATAGPATGAGIPSPEVLTHIFFIQKPAIATVTLENGEIAYKYGFHVLVPGVQLIRGYKRYLLRTLADDPTMVRLMNEIGAMSAGGAPGDCLDDNSASVPVLFLGSCKRGGDPYVQGPTFEVTFDPVASTDDPYASPPIIQQLEGDRLQGFNMVAELSVTEEATYPDGRAPLVRMAEYDYRLELQSVIETQSRRAAESGEVLFAENSLSTLTLTNPEARYLHSLLDLLDPPFYTDRNKWRNVVFALANTSDRYRPLAEWFSCKYGKWRDGTSKRIAAFDRLWDDAVARRGFAENPLTTGSIIHWAKQCNPQKFRDIMDKNYFEILAKYVYDYGGDLEHYMVAKVLYAMLGNKFVVDIMKGNEHSGPRGQSSYRWFEFTVPGQAMRLGEVWKWRAESKPDEIELYMSEQLPQVLEQILEHIKEKLDNPPDDNAAVYYKSLMKAFKMSRKQVFKSNYKKSVIDQCCLLFRKRGFLDTLDRDGTLLGCGNGVLRLGPSVELIDYYHEFPVHRFTPVPFVRFDPENPTPTQQIVLDSYASNIPEPDARELVLFHLSTGLAGGLKEPKMLLWDGGGKNGKTSTLMLWKNTLGDDHGTKLPIQLLSDIRESANSPNSAKMRLKGRRGGFFEESGKNEILNSATLKELVNPGEISASEKFQVQESFQLEATLVAATNHQFVINDAGHGMWRRLWSYTSKIIYCTNPNPESPYEKQDDPRYAKQYATDPEFLVANLGILVYFLERLHREYGGDISRIVCPTVEGETETFRNQQDMINRFIVERIVETPRPAADAPGDFLEAVHGVGPIRLDGLATKYTEWFNSNIERKRHVASEIIKDFENSALQKYIRRGANDIPELRGCRVLDPETDGGIGLRPGESYIGAKAKPKRNSEEMIRWIREGAQGRWWLPSRKNSGDAPADAPGDAAADDIIDDWLVLPGDEILDVPGSARLDAPGEVPDVFVGEDFLDDVLAETPAARHESHAAFTLGDLYD